jgi:hypothetical protein
MMYSSDISTSAKRLMSRLQKSSPPCALEHLAAEIVERLLTMPIAVAKAGFQHGGDAGPAGIQGRHFNIEAKRYKSKTSLNDRQLQGELMQALSCDAGLECWILVSTRSVPEQTQNSLRKLGNEHGFPVLIYDSSIHSLPALCSFAPDLVQEWIGTEAAECASALTAELAEAVQSIQRDLDVWQIGYESVCFDSHCRFERIWNSVKDSKAFFGQNIALGMGKRIRRKTAIEALDKWWSDKEKIESPAVLIGREGVGKTWAVADWVKNHLSDLPILLMVPASAASGFSDATPADIIRFLAGQLYDLCRVRDEEYWIQRVERFLKRPPENGPAFIVFLDGLNQASALRWIEPLLSLQVEPFAGRVRVILSTRSSFFEGRLDQLRALPVAPQIIQLASFDDTQGGELDSMLQLHGLTRKDLRPELLKISTNPRLFSLIIQLRAQLRDDGKISTPRILWEYGCNSLGIREKASFSEREFREFLSDLGNRLHGNHLKATFSSRSLSDIVAGPNNDAHETADKLSELVDGPLIDATASSFDYKLTPPATFLALGVSLVTYLLDSPSHDWREVNERLEKWFDPVSGLDETAEILRAAVLVCITNPAQTVLISGSMVTRWAQIQNLPAEHEKELISHASELVNPLLDTVERSGSFAQASAKNLAVEALHHLSPTDTEAFNAVVKRIVGWFRVSLHDFPRQRLKNPQHGKICDAHEMERQNDIEGRIGHTETGVRTILGISVEFVEYEKSAPSSMAARLLEIFPLSGTIQVFEKAAVVNAISGKLDEWDALKWICLLNRFDPTDTAKCLREKAEIIQKRPLESGVSAYVRERTSALLLWLTGYEKDEEQAICANPPREAWMSYEDYLKAPCRNIFYNLERRHAMQALDDHCVAIDSRTQRAFQFLLDPTFSPPDGFIEDLRAALQRIDPEDLDTCLGVTVTDNNLDELTVAAARFAPDLLIDLVRRQIDGLAKRQGEAPYWMSVRLPEHALVIDDQEKSSLRQFRKTMTLPEKCDRSFAQGEILSVELCNQSACEQFTELINAGLEGYSGSLLRVLQEPTSEEVTALIRQFSDGSERQKHCLLFLFAERPIPFTEEQWAWILQFVGDRQSKMRGTAFQVLVQSNAKKFGQYLWEQGWKWTETEISSVSDCGSIALARSSEGMEWENVLSSISPGYLLSAVQHRGSKPDEIRDVAALLTHLVEKSPSLPFFNSSVTVSQKSNQSVPILSIEPVMPKVPDGMAGKSFSMDEYWEAESKTRQRLREKIFSQIGEAKKQGAILQDYRFTASGLKLLIEHAPESVSKLLEGMDRISPEFVRHVQVATGLYLSLCEALVESNSNNGIRLWRALENSIPRINFKGENELEEGCIIPSRVPDSPMGLQLRDEALDLCKTDDDLLQIALLATMHGKNAWLEGKIEEDANSKVPWRERRAIVLSGLKPFQTLPPAEVWPQGEIKTGWAYLRRSAFYSAFQEASAHYWWKAYLESKDVKSAYSAWIAFLHSIDTRGLLWIWQDAKTYDDGSEFYHRKISHLKANWSAVKSSAKKLSKELEDCFLGHKICKGVSPWI